MELIFGFLLLIGIAAAFVVIFRFLTKRAPGNTPYKWGVGIAFAGALLLFWVNGAVGIIGASDNDANLMYFGVLAVGGLGGLISRFRPQGMYRVMVAVAVAQVLAAVIALAALWGTSGPIWPIDVLVLTGFFTAVWLVSAWQFRKAILQNSSI
jgi:hypothetical protein